MRSGPLVGDRAETRGPRPRGGRLTNPLRIGQIGVDRIQVFIRPVHGDTELLALVNRVKRLIAAGWEMVDVVVEEAPLDLTTVPEELARLRGSVTTGHDTGTSTDATAPALQRS